MVLSTWVSNWRWIWDRWRRQRPGTPRIARWRPSLEALEDRLAPSVTPVHLYDFSTSLADAMGGPALLADGGTLAGGRYVFGPNQGLRLNGGLANPADYSVTMSLSVNSLSPYFSKLIDFQGRTIDVGLYLAGGRLDLYPGLSGPDSVTANQDFQVVLTRDGASGVTSVYLNGILQQAYTGYASNIAIPSTDVLTFFEDDFASGGLEAVGGSVDYIATYDRPLTASEVANLGDPQLTILPQVSSDHATVTVSENQTATNTGAWSNAVALSASAGTVTQNSNGTWVWSFHATDGPEQSQTVTITATNSAGAQASTSFSLVVTDVPPVITSLSSSNPTVACASSDGQVTITGTFVNPGVLDTHTVTVDWGDGTAVQTLTSVDQVHDLFSGSHTYAHGGIFTIDVTVSDNEGGTASATTTAVVTGVGMVNGTLYVIGTNGPDHVDINLIHDDTYGSQSREVLRVLTEFDVGGRPDRPGVFEIDPNLVSSIVVATDAGNDLVVIHKDVTISVTVEGGDPH
jgi:hypothetical protein